MTTQEAIKQLQTEHDLIATERDLDGSQFAPALLEALAMAIEVMQGDGDTISRQNVIDKMQEVDWYHQNKNGEMVHGANSAEHQAWYKAEDVYKVLEGMPSAQPDWGKPVGDGRPLADSEIIPRLQDIKRQICGSYAIDRAIEVLEGLRGEQDEID